MHVGTSGGGGRTSLLLPPGAENPSYATAVYSGDPRESVPGKRSFTNVHSLTACLCSYYTSSLINFLHFSAVRRICIVLARFSDLTLAQCLSRVTCVIAWIAALSTFG